MTEIRLYLVELENNNKEEATKIAVDTAQRLGTKEIKLLGLIESLGEYLNNDEPITRERTMSFLADILGATTKGVIPEQHRRLLLDFVIARITDREVGIGSCAKAILGLEKLGNWDSGQVSSIIRALLENTHPLIQNGSQSQRYPTLLLLDLLLAKYRAALLEIHEADKTFLLKFITYFDGEKDPRNLMIVFSILNVIGTEWDISSCIPEVFDASFNYFPITFRPPPDDTYNITAQDLKNRLKACLASTSAFAPYVVPALLDKLDSTSLNTKRDVLQAFRAISEKYGTKIINIYSVTLWDAIKYEILNVQEEDLAEESLTILSTLTICLSRDERVALPNFIKTIIKECNEHLEDAPTKQSEAASRILFAITSSTWQSCNMILAGVLPHIFNLFDATKDMPKRRALTHTLAKLTEASCLIYGDWNRSPLQQASNGDEDSSRYGVASDNAFIGYRDQMVELVTNGILNASIQDVSFRLALLEAIKQLVKVRQGLSDDQLTQIIAQLNNIVLDEEIYGKNEVKIEAISVLIVISGQKSRLIVDQCFPAFFARLQDRDIPSEEPVFFPILEAIAKIGTGEKILPTFILRLKNKLLVAMHNRSTSTYIQAILSALLYAISHTSYSLTGDDNNCPFYKDLIVPLIRDIPSNLKDNQRSDAVFALIGRICNEILRRQTLAFQSDISIFLNPTEWDSPKNWIPDENISKSDGQLLIISLYLMASLQKSVPLEHDKEKLVELLLGFTRNNELTSGAQVAVTQMLSLMINKYFTIADSKKSLQPVLDEAIVSLTSIPTIFSILKALVLRNSPLMSGLLLSLFDRLADSEKGPLIAHGFSLLLQPDSVIIPENHCTISPLHKQKTFAIVVPNIAKHVRTATPEARRNYLVALSGILRWIPFEILEPEITSLSTLLIQTLDVEKEDEIRIGAMNQMTSILEKKGDVFEEHAGSIINRFLNLSSSYANPPSIRAKALQCLGLVPRKLRREITIPYRRQIIKKLQDTVDDRRRIVRSEAVRCRTRWIELDDVNDRDEDEE